MSRRVLIGISQSSGPFVGSLMQSSMQLAVPEAEEIIVAYNLDEFMDYLSLGEFDTIVCLEFIGMDYGYADYLLESGIEDKVCLFILPDQQKGDSTLKKYVDAGFNRFLFQKDMNNGSIKGMLKDGYDTAEDTLEYLGLYFRPVKVESPDVEKDSTVAGTQITRKYLGNGVAVTTLCGGDVRKLHITSADEDPVLSGLLSNQLDIERTTETMAYKEFPADEIWVQQYKEKIRQFYRTQGIMTLQSFENGDITRAVFERNVIKELMRLRLTDKQAQVVCESFMKDVLSYGRIDSLIQTPDVTDIRLMNKDTINVQYKGTWYRTNISFLSEDEYKSFIQRMCTINHAAVNQHIPEVIFTDIKTFHDLTLRITVTHGKLNAKETSGSHIRIERCDNVKDVKLYIEQIDEMIERKRKLFE